MNTPVCKSWKTAALMALATVLTPLAPPCAAAAPDAAGAAVSTPVQAAPATTPVPGAAAAPTPGHRHHAPNEPRRLPVFFLIGILINVAMMIFFAWWFVGEWRRNRR